MTDGDGGAWGRATTGYGDEVAPPAGITSLKLAKYGWRERNVDDEQIWLKKYWSVSVTLPLSCPLGHQSDC